MTCKYCTSLRCRQASELPCVSLQNQSDQLYKVSCSYFSGGVSAQMRLPALFFLWSRDLYFGDPPLVALVSPLPTCCLETRKQQFFVLLQVCLSRLQEKWVLLLLQRSQLCKVLIVNGSSWLLHVLQNAEVGILSKQTIFRETRRGPTDGVAFQLRVNPITRAPTPPAGDQRWDKKAGISTF